MQKQKIQELMGVINLKDQEIYHLKQKIQTLNHHISKLNITLNNKPKLKITSQYQILIVMTKNKLKDLKQIHIDIQKIDQSYSLKPSQFQNQKTQQTINDSIQSQLEINDPVFKIPCLSPTMIQMKCIEKVQNQRRKKLRQIKKDITGIKTIANQMKNIAAGISSPINQEMLNNVQNPLKNRFIRKPTSSILCSLSTKNKTLNDNSQPLTHQQPTLASPTSQINLVDSQKGKQPQKLNLPYFISLKKKNKENQK